jgi:hypothetical protein
MEPLPRDITTGDKYKPAMEITDQADAALYFERLVQHAMSWGRSRAEAENIERQNLGYWAGYYDSETRHRIEKLFRCAHPVFGAISAVGAPTAEEALQAGVDAARKNSK